MSARLLTLIPLIILTLPQPAQAAPPSLSDAFNHAARAGYRLGVHAMDAVDATPQQRRAVEDAGAQLARELRPLTTECEALVDGMVATWVAPTIEAEAVESLRQDTLSLIDAASSPVATFVVEAGNALTAEQRQALLDTAVEAIRERAQ